jgi:hypothetical protein
MEATEKRKKRSMEAMKMCRERLMAALKVNKEDDGSPAKFKEVSRGEQPKERKAQKWRRKFG